MQYNSFNEYLRSMPEDTIFRIWVRKSIFTPFEQENRFEDQSVYENDVCYYVTIKDVITLPDGDLLLAVCDCALNNDKYIDYYKLSKISLAKSKSDMEEFQ